MEKTDIVNADKMKHLEAENLKLKKQKKDLQLKVQYLEDIWGKSKEMNGNSEQSFTSPKHQKLEN